MEFQKMTREEFIQVLDLEGYSYGIEGDKIIVKRGKKGTGLDNHIYLDVLIPNVIFVNKGMVQLNNIASLPPGIEFKNGSDVDGDDLYKIEYPLNFQNGGHVQFQRLEILSSGVEFKNGREVLLGSLEKIPTDVTFNNKGAVYLKNIAAIETKTRRPVGYPNLIKGISDRKILNLMIKRGMFI